VLPCCCPTSRAVRLSNSFLHPAHVNQVSNRLYEPHALPNASVSRPCCAMQCTAMTYSQTIQAAVAQPWPCPPKSSLTRSPRHSAARLSENGSALVLRKLLCEHAHRSRCCASEPHRCPSTSMLGQGWPVVPWDGWCAGMRSRCGVACRAVLPSKARFISWPTGTLGHADTCLTAGCMQGHRQAHEPAPGCDSVPRLRQRAGLRTTQRQDRSGPRTDPAGAVLVQHDPAFGASNML